MTLATQCPHCSTIFKVDEQQLSAHDGLVRCGACTRVFNGRDYLTGTSADAHQYVEALLSADAATTSADQQTTPPTAPLPSLTAAAPETIVHSEQHEAARDDVASNTDINSNEPYIDVTRANSPTPDNFSITGEATPQDWDLPAQNSAPETAQDDAFTVPSEPQFIQKNRRRERSAKVLRIVMGLACIPLILAAIGQAVYVWRDEIALRYPAAKPYLVSACATLHCKVGFATDIEQLSLESNELEALPDTPNTYTLVVLLRNNSRLPQAWPYIELSLNDGTDAPMIRRVFAPSAYLLEKQHSEDGFKQHSEQLVRLRFTLPEGMPAGYRVYLFYP
jgi:predicted Zn finger-like uncharacterized protein